MKKNNVTLFHLQVDLFVLHLIIVNDSKIGLVDFPFPLWIGMLEELSFVSSWKDIQRAILFVGVFQ